MEVQNILVYDSEVRQVGDRLEVRYRGVTTLPGSGMPDLDDLRSLDSKLMPGEPMDRAEAERLFNDECSKDRHTWERRFGLRADAAPVFERGAKLPCSNGRIHRIWLLGYFPLPSACNMPAGE